MAPARLAVRYRLRLPADAVPAAAAALAVEQSVEMPLAAVADAGIRAGVVGQVGDIETLGEDDHRVTVHLAGDTTGGEIGQLLNMLFGNASIHAHVSLESVDFPPGFTAAFPGPRFGIDGVRRRLGVFDRALTASALKPLGSSPAALAALAGELAAAGIDLIKDDHGLANQTYAPFARRVAAVQRAIDDATRASGRTVLYAPSLTGGPKALREQAAVIAGEGIGAAMMAPMISGLPAFAECVAEWLDVPVLAHPAFAGTARMAPPLLIGTLFRLAGADAVIFPNAGGRFGYSDATCAALVDAARTAETLPGLRAALPVPAGGMSVAQVPDMLRRYGKDTLLLIGGALLAAPAGVGAAAGAFVAAVARESAHVR